MPGRNGESFGRPVVCGICNICRRPVEIFYAQEKYPLYVRPVPGDLVKQIPSLPIYIALCKHCNHVIQVNPPDDNLLENIYTSLYSSYHSTSKTGIGEKQGKQFMEFLLKNAGGFKNSPGRALEIGCSDGYFLSLLDEQGWEIYGCDPSPLIDDLEKTYGSDRIKRTFYSRNCFPEEYFELVVFRHLLEHLPDPVTFLCEVAGNLRPAGLVAVEVPDVSRTLQEGVAGDFCHEHLSYFTAQSLSIALQIAGFKNITVEQQGPFLYGLAQKLKNNIEIQVKLFARAMQRVRDELAVFQQEWEAKECSVFIYGAGGHTTGLFSRVMKERVRGLIDGDPGKWGKYLPGFDKEVFPPEKLEEVKPGDVVIVSSKVFQDEIVEFLRNHIERGVRVLVMYPHCRII